MSLKTRALCVSLNLSVWMAKRLDKKEGDLVAKSHEAASGTVEVAKLLVPKEAIAPVIKAASAARNKLYELTLPWGNEGVRILSADMLFMFNSEMEAMESAFNQAVATFCARYPEYVASAPSRLNGMYVPSDFPPNSMIRDKFGFRLNMMPVADQHDFRVEVGDDMEKVIRENIEQTVNARVTEAQQEVWNRLRDTLRSFVDALKNPKQIFRDSKLDNLATIAELAPKLTLSVNPDLTEVCGDLSALLREQVPDVLRKNLEVRAEVAEQAMTCLKRVERAMR